MQTNHRLAVLEGRWFEKENTSVKGLFDLLLDLQTGNPNGYHYQMFNTAESFHAAMTDIGAIRGLRHLYVAAHGDTGAIYGAGRNSRVPVKTIVAAVEEIATTRGSTLAGLYFGSCQVGRAATARKLLATDHGAGAGLRWIGGYAKDADWVATTAVDFFFWDRYLRAVDPAVGGLSEFQAAIDAAEAVHAFMPGAVDTYGFNVYVRKNGDVVPVL